MSQARRRAEQRGRWAEARAIAHLSLRGYRPIARRVRTGAGEVDLVMRKARRLILVEVKARPTLEGGLAALGERQRRRIEAAALLVQRRLDPARRLGLRFDLVVVTPQLGGVHHVKDAWRPR